MSPDRKRKSTCFVIMPFGEKTDADGPVDFDDVYENLIKKAIEPLGITCVRCDEIVEPGRIHRKMFEQVFGADVAVVDITQLNANVFYELGVRHGLRSHTTVLIKKVGTRTPFNIGDLDIVEYDLCGKLGVVEAAKHKIAEQVKAGLRSGKHDSPVHDVLDLAVVQEPHELRSTRWREYRIRNTADKRVGYVTGNLLDVHEVDVWVSSENTDMEPARLYDRSISSIIRYHGATCDAEDGHVVEDTIKNALAARVKNGRVEPGHVVATTSGALWEKNNVKRVFHAAAVLGQPGKGYFPIPQPAVCVRNAIDLADHGEFAADDLRSMIFPLLGTGTGRAKIPETARTLINEAVDRLQRPCQIDHVYFIVPNEEQRAACEQVLRQHPDLMASRGR